MAGLLEQYEQSSQIHSLPATSPVGNEKMVPMFSKQKVNFTPVSPITHLVVANNQLVIAMANKTLLRIDLLNPDNPQEVDLVRETAGSRVQHLFLDPTGQHLLISTMPREGDLSSASLFYINAKTAKPRLVTQLRGQLITAVGWDHGPAGDAVGPLLAGSSHGAVTELQLSADDGLFSRLELYAKQVLEVADQRPSVADQRPSVAVTGLEYHRVPDTDRYLVLVATPTRLYQFIGGVASHEARPLLTAVFTSGDHVSERFQEIPSCLSFSRLAFFYPTVGAPPDRFAWMTEPGILYGELDTGGCDTVLVNTRLIPHGGGGDGQTDGPSQPPQPPRALALTQFHVLSLFAARVRATCVLDQRHVFEDVANEAHGRLVAICRDPVRGTLWSAAERAVYKYKVVDETRDVWQLFVERGEYELARRYCQGNPAIVEKILMHQAEACYANADYATSARLFADTHRRLEEVAMKFVACGEYDALRQFLICRLAALSSVERVQAALLLFWALELFLTQLDAVRDTDRAGERVVRRQMLQFLTSHEALMHVRPARNAVYDLMARHGDEPAVIQLAEQLQDWGTVVRHYLRMGHVTKALETLRRQLAPDLLYRHVARLVQSEPAATIDLLIGQGRAIKPAALLPRLVLADTSEQQGVQIIRYLEFCIDSLESQANVAHNCLITLYVRYRPEKLMDYLVGQGSDRHCVHYSPGHVLRHCWKRQPRAAVHVLSVVGRFQDAVELALKHDVTLAKQVADMPEDDDTLKKRLWLQIAKHTIQHDQDVQRTMHFLKECQLLHIEDVLPFFPDFVTIDDFKEAICDSLQSYNENIGGLRSDMEEATRATEVLRQEINDFRRGYLTVEASDTCEVCGHQLLTRPLYVFPCGHRFHQDCLAAEVADLVTPEQREIMAQLERKLSTLPEDDPTVSPGAAAQVSARVTIREELDELVASQCLYCGDYLIRCLDDPLLNEFPGDSPQR